MIHSDELENEYPTFQDVLDFHNEEKAKAENDDPLSFLGEKFNPEAVKTQALEDAKTGNYQPNKFKDTARVVYVRAYLGAREKMGLLGIAGPGK